MIFCIRISSLQKAIMAGVSISNVRLRTHAKLGRTSQISVEHFADTISQTVKAKHAVLERLKRLVSILLGDDSVISPTSISTFRHLGEIIRGLIKMPFEDETSRLIIALYEAAFRPDLNTCTEEKCDICEGVIPLNELTQGVCERGHQFRKFTAIGERLKLLNRA